MALGEKFVIDAVVHGFDARPELRDGRPEYEYGWAVLEATYGFQELCYSDLADFALPRDEWEVRATAEAMASVIFAESLTDLAFFHTIPAWGIWPDLSPLQVGKELRELHPNRVRLYGGVSPVEGQKALDDLTRQREEDQIDALKLYPVDIVAGELRPWKMSDQELIYPVLERCQELGIGVVAVHKAFPIGLAPTEPFRTEDVDIPARDFPDLNFEIVHGGLAFLDETAFQLARFPNVFVNLEATSLFLLRNPALFARILGHMLLFGGGERIVWGSGASAYHPQPLLEAFERFRMPEQLLTEFGYPEVDDELKAAILAGNAARMHGIDLEQMRSELADDEVEAARRDGLAQPWSVAQSRAGA